MSAFTLTSPAFNHDDDLPPQYTQAGGDISPPLAWEGVPEGAKELIVICEDRDADTGVVSHWVVYGILPGEATSLPEGLGDLALVQAETFELCQGLNEFDVAGYSGPLADEDRGPHRYFFTLHALDAELDVPPGITRLELRAAAKDHIIASAELVGIG